MTPSRSPVDVDETALKAGSVGYWAGVVGAATVGAVASALAGKGAAGVAGGLLVGVVAMGALTAGATAGTVAVRPTLPGDVGWHRRGRAVAHGAAVAALWDVVAVFGLAVLGSQAPVGDATPADPVAAGARAALVLGLPKGLVLGACGAVVGFLLGPVLLGWE